MSLPVGGHIGKVEVEDTVGFNVLPKLKKEVVNLKVLFKFKAMSLPVGDHIAKVGAASHQYRRQGDLKMALL
jgi:hypothetical protein